MGRRMKEIKKIIIHCSDSDFGSVSVIDGWHKEKGWDGIGYHYVISNGVLNSCQPYIGSNDGVILEGRNVEKQGAHVRGHNSDSIGICLIGKHHFTGKQMFDALPALLNSLFKTYNLHPDNVFGHNEFNPEKTCPNFNVNDLRNLLKGMTNALPSKSV